MSTWNVITIEQPGDLTIETLPDALTTDGEIWEGWEADDDRIGIAPFTLPSGTSSVGRPGNPDGGIQISGRSKWRPDEVIASLANLPGRVEHYMEWDDDEPGASLDVYIDGVLDLTQCKISALVPVQMDSLVAAVREATDAFDEAPDIELAIHHAGVIRDAARALVDALRPPALEDDPGCQCAEATATPGPNHWSGCSQHVEEAGS